MVQQLGVFVAFPEDPDLIPAPTQQLQPPLTNPVPGHPMPSLASTSARPTCGAQRLMQTTPIHAKYNLTKHYCAFISHFLYPLIFGWACRLVPQLGLRLGFGKSSAVNEMDLNSLGCFPRSGTVGLHIHFAFSVFEKLPHLTFFFS